MADKEYIEREVALRVLCDACGNAACPKGLIPRCSYYEKMQSIPAADVRPVVRGKWTQHYVGDMQTPWGSDCSVCGEWLVIDRLVMQEKYHFCPNCGAEMRGEQDV